MFAITPCVCSSMSSSFAHLCRWKRNFDLKNADYLLFKFFPMFLAYGSSYGCKIFLIWHVNKFSSGKLDLCMHLLLISIWKMKTQSFLENIGNGDRMLFPNTWLVWLLYVLYKKLCFFVTIYDYFVFLCHYLWLFCYNRILQNYFKLQKCTKNGKALV